MKFKKIICWPPLLGGVGAGVTIAILAYITFQSILSGSNYGLWLIATFGSTVVLVFGYPDNDFAQPKNVLLGHLLCTLIGIIFVTTFKISQDRSVFFLAIGMTAFSFIFGKSNPDKEKLSIFSSSAWGNTL